MIVADNQDQPTPMPDAPQPQQPEPTGAPYSSPTPPPPAPGQQPPASPYAQPQQPTAPGQPVSLNGQPVNPYGQPMPGYYQQPPAKSGKATAALVCGIFAILLSGTILPSIILGIVAIVLAVKAVKEAGKDGKATGGKVCGIIGIVLSVLAFILYLVIGFGALAYVAAHPDAVSVTNNGSSYSDASSYFEKTEDEKQAEAAVQTELDKLKNKDAAFVQKLATDLDTEFSASSGYSLSELGVDPAAFAQWLLADFDYELDGAYTYSDGTGTVYADVTMRDAYAFASTFMTDAQAFANSVEAGSMDEAAVKAKLGEQFNAAMAKTADMTDNYVSLDLTKKDGTWTVDEDSWADEMEYLFGTI